MRKKLLLLLLFLVLPLMQGCSQNNSTISADSYFRIHIRANSNLSIDQNVKYKVKDEVVEYLTNNIKLLESKQQVINFVENNSLTIKQLCENTLKNNGFNYSANIVVRNEFFPTRAYGDYVLEADFYDALIIELGEAKGDNWWCVVYPPLCFLNGKEIDTNKIKYTSWIMELINKFFD